MKKYAKIINDETKEVSVGLGTNTHFYQSIGMVETEVEQAYTGGWYLAGFTPVESLEEKNERIRSAREQAYVSEADKLKQDYDEAVARGADNVEELKTAWLAKKDEIRVANPYIEAGESGDER